MGASWELRQAVKTATPSRSVPNEAGVNLAESAVVTDAGEEGARAVVVHARARESWRGGGTRQVVSVELG